MGENAIPLGRAIKSLLDEKGMNKIDLHRKSRVSVGYISDLTNGKKGGRVTNAILDALARGLDTTSEDLLHRAGLNP